MTYPQQAIKILKSRGYRITKPRKTVLSILEQNEEALSAYDIVDLVKEKGAKADVVSTYRTLEMLDENGLVHKVLSSGKYRKCHIHQDMDDLHHCHHNMICRICGKIEEIDCKGMELIEQVVESHSKFKIESHALEFYGKCANCS